MRNYQQKTSQVSLFSEPSFQGGNCANSNALIHSSYKSFFTDFGSLMITLLVYRTDRERSAISYLSENSECGGYYCDINVNNPMYIVLVPLLLYIPLSFYVFIWSWVT